MEPKHIHTPTSNRARCPVCHQAVYSRSGIHPQCAMRQAELLKPKGEPPKAPIPVEAAALEVLPPAAPPASPAPAAPTTVTVTARPPRRGR